MASSSCLRILGECSTIHSVPALFFSSSEVEISSHTLIPLFGQDQSTVAQRAEMTVTECSLASCVWACFLIGSHTMPGQQHSLPTPTSFPMCTRTHTHTYMHAHMHAPTHIRIHTHTCTPCRCRMTQQISMALPLCRSASARRCLWKWKSLSTATWLDLVATAFRTSLRTRGWLSTFHPWTRPRKPSRCVESKTSLAPPWQWCTPR